jgi:hypothetical protein
MISLRPCELNVARNICDIEQFKLSINHNLDGYQSIRILLQIVRGTARQNNNESQEVGKATTAAIDGFPACAIIKVAADCE